MEVLIAVVIGFAVGFVFACLGVLGLKIGTLRIDRSDPDEEPYMFLEINKGVGDISNRKYVLMEVSNENFISQ